MMHIVIQTEKRQNRPANEMAVEVDGQLHTTGSRVNDLSSDQIVYAAEWQTVTDDDGTRDVMVVLKGDKKALTTRFMGWPE